MSDSVQLKKRKSSRLLALGNNNQEESAETVEESTSLVEQVESTKHKGSRKKRCVEASSPEASNTIRKSLRLAQKRKSSLDSSLPSQTPNKRSKAAPKSIDSSDNPTDSQTHNSSSAEQPSESNQISRSTTRRQAAIVANNNITKKETVKPQEQPKQRKMSKKGAKAKDGESTPKLQQSAKFLGDSDELEGSVAKAPAKSQNQSSPLFGGSSSSWQRGPNFKAILGQLKSPNQTLQLIALQELTEMLSVATEEMFVGPNPRYRDMDTNAFIQALISIIKGRKLDLGDDIPAEFGDNFGDFGDFGGDELGQELILLACRCLSNLFEAHPGSIPDLAAAKGVRVLVSKLLEIEYIDLAEQVLAVLDKVAVEVPTAIIRANALPAILQYIEFFSLHVQRTAMAIVANSCRSLLMIAPLPSSLEKGGSETVKMIKETLPTLDRLVQSTDLKLAEHAVTSLTRVIDWCSKDEKTFESLITPNLVSVILNQALVQASGDPLSSNQNLANPSFNSHHFSQLIRMLSTIAPSSQKLAASLLQEGALIEIVRRYLCGPNADILQTSELAGEVTSVILTKKADQVMDILKLVNDTLPGPPRLENGESLAEKAPSRPSSPFKMSLIAKRSASPEKHSSKVDKQLETILANSSIVSSYITTLLPILFEVLNSSLNLAVRHQCAQCILKIVCLASRVENEDKNLVAGQLEQTLTGTGSFGKCLLELLGLYISYQKQHPAPSKDTTGNAGANNGLIDSIRLVMTGVQIITTVFDHCGITLQVWLIREGIFNELLKLASLLKTQAKSQPTPVEETGQAKEKEPLALAESTPSVPTAPEQTKGVRGTAASSLLSDLKRFRDQVIGNLAGESSNIPVTGSAATDEAQRTSPIDVAPPNDQNDVQDEDSNAQAGSIFSHMRKAFDRLTRGSMDSDRSAQETGEEPRIQINSGEKWSQSQCQTWLLKQTTSLLERVSSLKDKQAATKVIQELQEIGQALQTGVFKETKDQLDAVAMLGVKLHEFARRLSPAKDETLGVTTFELLESGIIDCILEYFGRPGVNEGHSGVNHHSLPISIRIQALVNVFLHGPAVAGTDHYVPTAFSFLITRLQDCLSRTESCNIATASRSSSTQMDSLLSLFGSLLGGSLQHSGLSQKGEQNFTAQLSKQIRLRVVADTPEAVPSGFRDFMISVHAVSTFRTLEEFLKRKVVWNPKGASADQSSDQADDDDDDDGDSADDEEKILSISPTRSELDSNLSKSFEHRDLSQMSLPRSNPQMIQRTPAKNRRESIVDVISSSIPGTPSPLSVMAGQSPSKRNIAAIGALQTESAAARSESAGSSATNNEELLFTIDGKEVPLDATIFGFLYSSEQKGNPNSNPDVWARVCTVKYQRRGDSVGLKNLTNNDTIKVDDIVSRPDALMPSSQMDIPWVLPSVTSTVFEALPAKILRLLRILFTLNTRWSEILQKMKGPHANMPPNPVVDIVAIAADGAFSFEAQPEKSTDFKGITNYVVSPLPTTCFTNNKITAKLDRQLNEPLIVMANVLPPWCKELVRDYWFLVPFESRLSYIQATSFGSNRAVSKWTQGSDTASNSSQSSGPRLSSLLRSQKQKVRISRQRILDSMCKIVDLYAGSQNVLEIEFFDEVGTGLGPTLEFYSLVSKELCRREGVCISVKPDGFNKDKQFLTLHLWRDDGATLLSSMSANNTNLPAYLHPPQGLFPRPITNKMLKSNHGVKLLSFVKSMGAFVARAMMDGRLIDIPFSPLFLEMVVGYEKMSDDAAMSHYLSELHLLQHVDPILFNSLSELNHYLRLKRNIEHDVSIPAELKGDHFSNIRVKGAKLEELSLDFTLPGYSDIELKENGSDIPLTLENLEEYISAVVEMTVGSGVQSQIQAFQDGFNSVFPAIDLQCFSVQELELLLCGSDQDDWSFETLLSCVKADHGYTQDSKVVRLFAEMLSTFTPVEKREFLMFVTGSPKLPIGGFRSLNPPLTVVRKQVDRASSKPDDYLPSVMTCVNYLKIPEYASLTVMKQRFEVAMKEGQGCFHLS